MQTIVWYVNWVQLFLILVMSIMFSNIECAMIVIATIVVVVNASLPDVYVCIYGNV